MLAVPTPPLSPPRNAAGARTHRADGHRRARLGRRCGLDRGAAGRRVRPGPEVTAAPEVEDARRRDYRHHVRGVLADPHTSSPLLQPLHDPARRVQAVRTATGEYDRVDAFDGVTGIQRVRLFRAGASAPYVDCGGHPAFRHEDDRCPRQEAVAHQGRVTDPQAPHIGECVDQRGKSGLFRGAPRRVLRHPPWVPRGGTASAEASDAPPLVCTRTRRTRCRTASTRATTRLRTDFPSEDTQLPRVGEGAGAGIGFFVTARGDGPALRFTPSTGWTGAEVRGDEFSRVLRGLPGRSRGTAVLRAATVRSGAVRWSPGRRTDVWSGLTASPPRRSSASGRVRLPGLTNGR